MNRRAQCGTANVGSVTQETARGGMQKIKAQPDDISVRGIELEPAVARLMTKASLDGSPRSPRSPELSMNYARTQWKLALHWQGFFFFGELDARPCHIPVPPTRRRDDDGDEAGHID